MPPKKKIVKKTIRKAKSNAQTPPPPPSEPESSTPVTTDGETLAPSDAYTDTPVLPAREPAAEETPASGSATNEALELQPAVAAETLAEEPEPAAANETLVEEPAATESIKLEPAAAETGEEPSEATKKKTVTRVRKVVKKKIVKKLVPKTAAATKEESVEAKKADEEAEEEEGSKPSEEHQMIENASSSDAPAPMETLPEAAGNDAEIAGDAEEGDAEKVGGAEEVDAAEKAEDAEKIVDAEEVDAGEKAEDAEKDMDAENVDAGEKAEDAKKDEDAENIDAGEKAKDAEKDEDGPKEEEQGGDLEMEAAGNEQGAILESNSRKKTEIFIGGLDRDAKEEDLRKVFGEVGEIVEVRLIMDGQSGKNKGYAFLRYADATQAKKAVARFEKVEICGKQCGASALKGNDTIFLGNIDKKWKKEDLIKLLQGAGIEKIEAITMMPDSNNADTNRGFAFLELETNKDAQTAFKKLQKKDAFGKGRNIKVAWAEPLNDPDEEEMKKVKSVFAEGIPASWDEEKVRECFKKFGEIERIVVARNIKSSKRKDFAFVNYKSREAALLCIGSFDEEELTENGSKVNVKVSLAKPVQKSKQNKGVPKSSNKDSAKEKPQRDTKPSFSSTKGRSSGASYARSGDMRSSTNHEPLHVPREQATWQQGQIGYARGPIPHDYAHGTVGKRPFSSLGGEALYSDMRGYPRARLDSFPSAGPSYGAVPRSTVGPSHPYYQHQGSAYTAGAQYGAMAYPATHQMRQGAPPYGNNYHSRY